MKKVVLDIGAGELPDRRATHALDVWSKEDLSDLYRGWQKKLRSSHGKHVSTRAHLRKLKELVKGGAYFTDVDMKKRRTLPKDLLGKVDLFVSNAALGIGFGGDKVGKNLALLGKPHAKAEIRVGYIGKADRQRVISGAWGTLMAGGFRNIKIDDKREAGWPHNRVIGELVITGQRDRAGPTGPSKPARRIISTNLYRVWVKNKGKVTAGYTATGYMDAEEIWQIPLEDYVKSLKGQRIDLGPKPHYYNRLGQIHSNHRHAVEAAFQGGKPISPEVLKDYPELQREIARRTAGHKVQRLSAAIEKPIQMMSAAVEAPPGTRWTVDPGAIPGEPAYFLDDIDKPKAAISLIVTKTGEVLYEVVSSSGKKLGIYNALEKASQKAEAEFPARKTSGYADQQKGSASRPNIDEAAFAGTPFQSITDMPYYDGMLKNPEYYRREKGKVYELRWVTPDEYLAMSAKAKGVSLELDRKCSEETLIKEYATAMKRGDKFPMLMVEEGKQLQEGKHRALAAKEAGVAKVPVMVVSDVTGRVVKAAAGYKDADLEEKRAKVKILPLLTTTDGVTAYLVSGKLIKVLFNMDFVEGSNHFAPNAAYVPEDEVWIDNNHEPEQQDDVMLHELHERNLMKPVAKGGLGFPYGVAHNFANYLEKQLRVGKLKLPQGEGKSGAMTDLAALRPYERAYATRTQHGKIHVGLTPARKITASSLAHRHNGKRSKAKIPTRSPLLITRGGRKVRLPHGSVIPR